jgi:aminoglycoside phosphotransferase family enzyme/predicted kinase
MSDFPSQQKLIAALCDPKHSPLGPGPVRLVETHISWVLLAGRFAYKIKKAVDLEFLDFTELASRRFFCQEELRLNRRMGPQLYLDVMPIGGSPGRPLPGREPAIEYAVRMRRFPAGKLLDKLLVKGAVTPQHMDSLAMTLAAFHRALPAAAPGTPWGSPASIGAAATQNFDQMAPLLPDAPDRSEIDIVRRLTEAAYAAHQRDFAARREQGFVRECHGDLHLGNVALIRGVPVPFDGIEFSADLRWQDVMSETAFLTMDLLYHDESALAFRFLNSYLEAGGDYAGLVTLPFYLAYRAMVRAKIGAIRAAQPGMERRARNREISAARQYLTLAQRCLEARRGALIITHGLPGSGKTTFSQLALERLGAIRLRSDVERKRLFGLGPLEDSRNGGDIYGAEATRRTYARLHELARIALDAGFPVIVDAAFLRRDEREHFRRLAGEMGVPFAIASLHAPDAVLQTRLAQRQARANDASEADAGVLAMLRTAAEPLAQDERASTVEFSNDDGVHAFSEQQDWAQLETAVSVAPMG